MVMPQPAKAASVLLVEDEALISEFIAEELSAHGFTVHAVPNAADALDYMNAGAQVDILFTDVDLPGGGDDADDGVGPQPEEVVERVVLAVERRRDERQVGVVDGAGSAEHEVVVAALDALLPGAV